MTERGYGGNEKQRQREIMGQMETPREGDGERG